MRESIREMRLERGRCGFCPACGRWVLLDPVWRCRHCRRTPAA